MNVKPDFLNKMRLQGDKKADGLMSDIFKNDQKEALYKILALSPEEGAKSSSGYEPLDNFMQRKRQKPEWYDEKQMDAGAEVYAEYASEIMMLLGAMALPYCYAATPGNKTLYLSEKIRKTPGKRLLETAEFVIDLMEPDSLKENGAGHWLINKTRLIHAMVRMMIGRHPDYKKEWGIPANQEDMAGTNLAFSFIVLKGLSKMGYRLSIEEKEAFLYRWRYIGYQLHLDDQLLVANLKDAMAMEIAIKERNFKKSEEGILLTHALIDHYQRTMPKSLAALVKSQIRFFLGNEVSTMVGLAKEPLKDALTVTINNIRSVSNQWTRHQPSLEQMRKDHELLKQKYA